MDCRHSFLTVILCITLSSGLYTVSSFFRKTTFFRCGCAIDSNQIQRVERSFHPWAKTDKKRRPTSWPSSRRAREISNDSVKRQIHRNMFWRFTKDLSFCSWKSKGWKVTTSKNAQALSGTFFYQHHKGLIKKGLISWTGVALGGWYPMIFRRSQKKTEGESIHLGKDKHLQTQHQFVL